ncbi:MAG: DUF86 domain-containing protein, partial [Thermomicrobiales bacterium]|nr:DUF86 domain-containing protein [Thermomicrobiales bacterium]
ELIQTWVQQYNLESITNDPFVESAFMHRFMIIGESLRIVRDMDDEFAETIPDIHSWIGLRHRLIHEYIEVDLDLLWTSSVKAIPTLIGNLKKVLL